MRAVLLAFYPVVWLEQVVVPRISHLGNRLFGITLIEPNFPLTLTKFE